MSWSEMEVSKDELTLKVRILEEHVEDFDTTVSVNEPIDNIFTRIGERLNQRQEEFNINWMGDGGPITDLGVYRDKSLVEAGLYPLLDIQVYGLSVLRAKNVSLAMSDASEDELHLGASASPTSGDTAVVSDEFRSSEDNRSPEEYNTVDLNSEAQIPYTSRRKATCLSPILGMASAESTNYVGLVNQAMTCYLNSLLQTLYMTPEFRNALYNWEFDGSNETRNIPYQLQKLFLNLQTSSKSAVETTDLTTSFGWQGSDAWQQHDVQELCRVMFDALEQKFKNTKQANLINDLYEGKMLDYVKCLECNTEKSREDTFLDIPLPVRPFGSVVAYNSVEEALRGFVQPETLDGRNQYFCEKCNKLCDAHKGLKFTKFPYLLTLHLKRFDFDYSTMHRIKLNDKVVFPEQLNLNSFIPTNETAFGQSNGPEGETIVKGDDCSTADSGSADDESCQGTDLCSSAANGQDDNCADSDEGIDVSSGNNHENDAKGPYVYELFSIMIHSGSASGGHYYAYIRDFDKDSWYCFNDQIVSPITEEDIKKTYGGGPRRAYYSGAYTSSTNAYMLMYRQLDKERNCRAKTVDEFPPHIQQLLNDMRRKEEEDRLNKLREDEMLKLNVISFHGESRTVRELKISVLADSTLGEVALTAYDRFRLENTTKIKDCRLVAYNKQHKCIDFSFESDDVNLKDVCSSVSDWYVDIREPGTPWTNYEKGAVSVKVQIIDLATEELDEPLTQRFSTITVGKLREQLGNLLQCNATCIRVIIKYNSGKQKYLADDDEEIDFYGSNMDSVLFVTCLPDKQQEKRHIAKFKALAEMFRNVVYLTVYVPIPDETLLETLAIPLLDLNQNVSEEAPKPEQETDSSYLRVSPQPSAPSMSGDGFDQSNSEDSSLSDSDRTLIGDAPDLAMLSSQSASPIDQHMASPADPCQDTYNYDVLGRPGVEESWDTPNTDEVSTDYFRVVKDSMDAGGSDRRYKILLDNRMSLETFKKRMEQFIKVPSLYFKVFILTNLQTQYEMSLLTESLRSLSDRDGLLLKFDRVLKEDEQVCKVYYLNLATMEPNKFLFEHVIRNNQSVYKVRTDIVFIAKKQQRLDLRYSACRLREKCWRKPKKVYLDDQKFGTDIQVPYNFEMYIQELSEPETVTSAHQMLLFVRQFSPFQLALGPFQEIILDVITMEDLLNKISTLSSIPVDQLDVAYVKGSYPYDMHILEIYDDMEWNPKIRNLDEWPLHIEDGCMFIYKDRRERLKQLTAEEKKRLCQSEDSRLGRMTMRTFSPGRERALKIYLYDSKQENDID